MSDEYNALNICFGSFSLKAYSNICRFITSPICCYDCNMSCLVLIIPANGVILFICLVLA